MILVKLSVILFQTILPETSSWSVRSVATDVRYVQLSDTLWLGIDGLGQQTYQEVFRNLTIIKLEADDGSQLLFDFWRGGIFTKTGPGDIMKESREDLKSTQILYINRELKPGTAAHRVKGPELKLVSYDDGAFVQVQKDLWIENNAEGTRTYRESHRDEWSVYLTSSDNRFVQLDVHTMEIWSTGPGHAPRTLLQRITGTAKADTHRC